MQHLGRAEAVDDLAAEVAREALADVARQRFAGRRAQAKLDLRSIRQIGRREHAGIAGRRAEEQRHAVLRQPLEDRWRRRPFGHQHGGRADAQREGQRVAETVGEEQFRGREQHVGFAHAEHRAAEQRCGPVEIGVGVDRALRAAGRAR